MHKYVVISRSKKLLKRALKRKHLIKSSNRCKCCQTLFSKMERMYP